ncbi:interferon-induced very large GTPase 1-like isoform X3 [Xiphophorus maculatus]|uniref:interferon-induced very large GTPase 1-like isoform X3 n=1 Tax=Xiphophorus maculatus TaxID=8083 RepID=UPI000C6CFF63|nr:interferon-induced very large GTPase 1-like isoform X3 [Xiphophorus maculatus]
MATNNPRRALIFKIQKKLGTLSTEQLQTVLSSTDDGGDIHVHDLSEPELYDLIVDFVKSEKLKASEDEGMAQLLLLDEQISNLLATDVGATGDDPTTLSRTDMSASQTGCPASLQLGLINSGLQTATPATDIPVQPTETERGSTDDIPPTTGGSTDDIPPTTGGSTDDQPPTASETVMNSRDTQHAERRDKNVQEETENISGSPPSNEVTPPLTLVLIGNKNSIDIGSKNILLDHDQEIHVKESRLYDLFGDQITLINMLGFPSIDTIPEIPQDCAFILLVSNDRHENQYTSGMQWLEKTLGKEHSSYVMTVVTHDDSEEISENELQKLKAKSVFSEKRNHTCTRSMKDENEIVALWEKINDMVSENRRMMGGNQANPAETLKTVPDLPEGRPTLQQINISAVTRQRKDGGHELKPTWNTFQENQKKHQTQTEKLLRRLHLQDQHQHMLSSEDFVQIGPPIKKTNEIFERDLVCAFLQRLMMLDYRARYIPVQQESADVNNSQAVQVSDSAVTDDDDLDALFTTNVDIDQSKENHVHPMDVQMAVFHCSDSFFKQKMITKLSQCQYALPLLAPDPHTTNIECPLWTFRQITKTWKISTNKENATTVTMKSMPIYKAEIPMVSFFRLGSMSLSKSQLMNALINNRHDTFFHRNCEGSTKSRHLMDGVAEIAWYCPAGKDNDFFTDCIAFCNLHGDSLAIGKQREILTEMSSVIVVLVPTLEKSQESTEVISMLYKSSKPLIILNADNDCSAVRVKPQKYKLGLKERSQSDVSTDLKKIIKTLLSEPHTSFRLETMAKVSGIIVDEDQKICQNGKSAAMEIIELIEKMNVAKIKDKFLPCQGQLWSNWCKINKELHHLKGDIEKEKGQKSHQLMKLRKKQCDVSDSKLMRLFTQRLQSLPPKEREYFLTWTQILIDALSTDDLSSILQNYDETWSEVLVLKKKHDKSAQLKHKQTELEQLSKKLQSATFGLEHIFREMGQIYEAHKSLNKPSLGQQPDWTKYPELAADLMISGHPMELMDGDAGHVPLIWISNLLQEVIKKLDDRRVFVLSVLGVQSSGKSTMLNAMFGLQFAVSAGRCTKGAYMQLVKLSEENKDKYQFDYILVVDTEGLRALELAGNATRHHDNELATFVVGLGNMTLINIFGENPADMQDVLQIVVQAFMRMKKVKLSPSCVFVHQNVTDITAAEKNMDGKRRLQEKLDKMAQLAAKEELCDVECFSDVIAFDVQKDVKYFAQLWEGSPPMAPPNPGYSESVQELKSIILSKAKQSTGITLSHFSTKIQDLWNALMNEHFVFSFKNTQEIAVYRKLEVQYGNWTWVLRSEMLNIENQLYPRIEKGQLDKVELSYLNKEMAKTYAEVTKSISTYFEDDKDKEMLVQWRGRFETKIKEFHDDLVRGVKRKLDELIQQNNARKMLDKKKTEFENKLLHKSKELAHQLKCIDDEEELKADFNTVWNYWVKELTSDTKPIENINLEEDQHLVLLELGVEHNLIDESKRSKRYKNLSEHGDYSDYITMKKSFGGVCKFVKMTFVPHEEQELIRSFINEVEQKCLAAIKSKPVATRGFTSTYLKEVAQNIKSEIQKLGSQRNYVFKKEFTVDLSLYVFDRAEGWLLNSHKIYRDNNDALTYLDSKKNEYYNIFRSFCKGSSSAVVFGEIMCEKLKVSAVEAVCNKTGVDIAGEMMCSFPAFSENRLNLEKHVLASLAEKEDFSRFISYIRNPRAQVEAFIKEEVKKYMFTTQKVKAQIILKKNIEDITRVISQALFEATEKFKHRKGNIEKWVEEFSSKLKPKLTLDTISCQNFSDINNFEFLKEEIEKGLKSITTEMSKLSLEKVNKCRQKPDQILIDQLCNCCWERCPFCAAVCTNTLKDHSPEKHSVPFHRPSGVEGWHVRGTVDLVIDFCTTLVASDRAFYPGVESEEAVPFKQYPTAGEKFASWSITADASMLAYWKWFICHFQNELEDYYDLKFQGYGEIPQHWKNFSKQDAIESLDEMCSL